MAGKISAFDPDLNFIASEAAFEVDNLVVENPADLRSVKKIMLSICEAISDKDGSIDVDSCTKNLLFESLRMVNGLATLRAFLQEVSWRAKGGACEQSIR